MDKQTLQRAAHITTDSEGNPVVQLPLSLWEAVLASVEDTPQDERIKALLASWDADPDPTPSVWWDEFAADLRASRFRLPKRDLGSDHS
ncbi:MAG TPA: hypothetical protein PLD47_15800 [Aggregatilineales bacterium]|nr:hypothetical protein [Anaerolineales bacterium]HRE49193.1 hypothetical protein [Aggregatilineales bacterium]